MRHIPQVIAVYLLVLLQFPGCSGCDKGGGSHEVPVWNECDITFLEAPSSSSEKETLLRFNLENCEGAREVAVRRGDLFFPATDMGLDVYRRYVPLLEGENTLSAVAKNAEGAEAESDPLTVTYAPTEPLVTADSAWIHGSVFQEATGAPIEGAEVYVRGVAGVLRTESDGTFAFPTPAGGAFLLTVEAEGYTLAQRRVTVDSGRHASVKPAYLVALDERTETFTSASGGSLVNSAGDVEVHAPAGAVRSDTEVSAVAYPAYRSLPGELPDISAWTQALELWPEGARFDEPVEVRVENVNGFAPGTRVPAGYYNRDIGAWEHQAMGEVTPDGQWIVFSVTHFSPIDCNEPADERSRGANGKGDKDPCKKGRTGASIIDDFGGQLTMFHPASLYLEEGEPAGLHLVYNSGAAAGDADVIVPVDTGPTTDMERLEAVVDFEGTMKILGLDATSGGRFNVATRFQGVTPDGDLVPSGIYPAALELTKYEYSTYMTAAYFGGAGLESTGVRTREALPYSTREGVPVMVHDLGDSVFGAGWTLDVLEEVRFNDSLGFALILKGTGAHEPVVTGLPVADPLRLPVSANGAMGHAYAPDGTLVIADGSDDIYLADSRASAESAAQVGAIEGVQNVFSGPGGVMATNYDMDLYSITSGGEITQVMNLGESWSAWAFGQMGSDNPPPLGSTPDLDAGIVADREGVLWMMGLPVWGEKYLVSVNPAVSPVEWKFYTLMSFVEEALPGSITYDRNEHALYYAYFEEGLIRRFDIDAGNESVVIQDDDLLGEVDVMRLQRDGRGNLYVIKLDRVMRFSRHGVKARLAGDQLEQIVLFLDVTPEGLLQDVAVMPDGKPSFLVFESYDYETYMTLEDPDRGWVNESTLQLARDEAGATVTEGGEIHRYDAQGRITSITDPAGREARFTYGADGLESYTSPYGYTTQFVYAGGRISEIVDPAGRARTLNVGPAGTLESITDSDGREITFQYDPAGRLTEKRGDSGTITYTYDETGSVSLVELDTGELIQFQSMLQAAQPEGIASAADAASTVTDGEGNVHRSVYSMDGLLSSYSLNGDTYEFAHEVRIDFTGWDTTIVDPKTIVTVQHDGTEVVSSTLNQYGEIVEQSLYGSVVVTSGFGYENELVDASYFDSSCDLWSDAGSLDIGCDEMSVTLYYDADGYVVQMDDGGYGSYMITNDAHGNPVAMEDPLGGVTTLTRDDAGNITQIEDPDGRITQLAYTHDNEIASITDNTAATWSAGMARSGTCSGCAGSGESVLATVTDPFGRDWTATVRSDGAMADFTTPEGHVTTYTYNGNRMLAGVSREDGRSASFVYNDHDQLDSMTLDGETTTYAYDGRRLLVSASSPDFTITWDRDYVSNTIVETVTDEVTGFSRSLTVTYDPERGVDTALQTDSGLDLTLDYVGGRVSELSQAGGSVLYIDYAPPWVTSVDAENSSGDTMMSRYLSLDELRRIDGIDVYAGSSWLDGATLSYDGYADEPSALAWSEGQFESMTFAYEGVGRLASAVGLAVHSFGYDLGGRITSSAYAGTFTYDNDWRVISTNRATYTYHPSGSRATRTDAFTGEHWQYDADALGFLREIRKYASSTDVTPYSTVRLFYDPLYRLARIEEDGVSIQYQWYDWSLVGEFNDAGNVTRRYIPSYGMDGVGVIQEGGEDLYAITDTNGSVLKLVDASQTERASYRYDPYGRVLEALGDRAGQPRRFAGALWLQSIGLYYFRTRLMDPEIGQFTSMDALWTLQIQPYAYCGGKPTRCNDPLGLEGPGTVDSAKAVGGLAWDQVKGGLEGHALGPLQPLKGLWDATSGYKRGDNRHNGSVALKKIGSVTFLDKAPWWKKIVKKVEGFWDMVTGKDKKKDKKDPCKPRIGRVLGSFRG